MAKVAACPKRSFETMSDESAMDLPGIPFSDPEVLVSRGNSTISEKRDASIDPSSNSTPQDTPPLVAATVSGQTDRKFRPDASIVLIGMRGCGLSSLAIMASLACRRRIIEVESLFQQETGFSTANYRKQFGAGNYNLRQEELVWTTLKQNSAHAIITVNGGSLEKNSQMLMQEFAREHPVIHISRDTQSVCEYLGGIDPQRFEDMLAFTTPILRNCANYEFHNIDETQSSHTHDPQAMPTGASSVTLKQAQRTFLRFLSSIMSGDGADGVLESTIPQLEPGYPLSDVPAETRNYTCAVQVLISDILAHGDDIQQAEYGADAFEVVVDPKQLQHLKRRGAAESVLNDISICISKVRRCTVVPIIYHAVPSPDTDEESLETYDWLLHHGLRTAPDYITVDLSRDEDKLTRFVEWKGRSKVIGHLHADRTWNDEYWITSYDKAIRLGCVLARFTRPAKPLEDDFYLHELRHGLDARHDSIPLTCYNTGKAGRTSACFSQHLTPVAAASSKSGLVGLEVPCVTAREISQALYASFTLDRMRMYILGASLGYTVSPAMHNAAYEAVGLPHRFSRVQTSTLNSLKELVREPDFGGCIIIQPYKVEVMSLTDSLSQHARAIGAVNTLIPVRHLKSDNSVPDSLELFHERSQSGPVLALYGENTEWIGIRSCVRRGLSPANAIRPRSCGLIVGAGGMARAAVYAMVQLGVKNIAILNRTPEKAGKLVAHFQRLLSTTTSAGPTKFHILGLRDEEWPEGFRQPTIIISCIPTDPIDGGPAAKFTLPPSWMQSPTGGVVLEVAYKTLSTPLSQQVHAAGSRWIYYDGLDFLPEQAFAQFELFTAKRAPRRRMREEVLRAWRDNQGEVDGDTNLMIERRLRAIDDQEP